MEGVENINPNLVTGILRWGFERASEPLLKMYRHPGEPAAGALLHRGGVGGAQRSAHDWEAEGQNALADALSVVGTHAHAFSADLRCLSLTFAAAGVVEADSARDPGITA